MGIQGSGSLHSFCQLMDYYTGDIFKCNQGCSSALANNVFLLLTEHKSQLHREARLRIGPFQNHKHYQGQKVVIYYPPTPSTSPQTRAEKPQSLYCVPNVERTTLR